MRRLSIRVHPHVGSTRPNSLPNLLMYTNRVSYPHLQSPQLSRVFRWICSHHRPDRPDALSHLFLPNSKRALPPAELRPVFYWVYCYFETVEPYRLPDLRMRSRLRRYHLQINKYIAFCRIIDFCKKYIYRLFIQLLYVGSAIS